MARQRDGAGKHVLQVTVVKDRDVEMHKYVKRLYWKEYFKEMMDMENERETEDKRRKVSESGSMTEVRAAITVRGCIPVKV